ncbi:MAG: hypothetical protein QM473_04265 [Acidobacteriota bacterium]|nr:hypothetical protein [Acidobacteriota bacterium]
MKPLPAALLFLVLCVSLAAAELVDEPAGARYSLGLTLWHLGHRADMIQAFHEFCRVHGRPPELVPESAKGPLPETTADILLEPELIPEAERSGWGVRGQFITSGATDAGPTVSFPLSVPRSGLWRLWVQYWGWKDGTGVTRIRIYPKGREDFAPIVDDEIYDYAAPEDGLHWKDVLIDLEAGEYRVSLGHVTRWWHAGNGPRGYRVREIDCLYLTQRPWEQPPDGSARDEFRATSNQTGIQWQRERPLDAEAAEKWRQWQVRPISWDQREADPALFELSRRFWRQQVDALAAQGYDEAAPPDYRDDRRQVIFDDRWNLVGNPVRIRRQIEALQSDIRGQSPHVYHWINAGEFDEVTGGWERRGTELAATYSDFSGEAKHSLRVDRDGDYTVWVRFRNIDYHAPWRVTVTAPNAPEIAFERDQQSYPKDGPDRATWQKVGTLRASAGDDLRLRIVPRPFRAPGTYRGIYSFVITTDPDYTPHGPTKPAVTVDQYLSRATALGASPEDGYLLWTPPDPYTPLAHDSWPDDLVQGSARETARATLEANLSMASDSVRAIPVYLRSLQAEPADIAVECGPLVGRNASYDAKVAWRTIAFVPFGPERHQWSPFALLRRPWITLPAWNLAGIWLTVDSSGVKPGQYTCDVSLRAAGLPERTVRLNVRVSPVRIEPRSPVLVGGWTAPPEGEEYWDDYRVHGMNIGYGDMTKEEMIRRGIRLLALPLWEATPETVRERIAKLRAGGLDYSDFIFTIRDEPSGETEEKLKPYLDVARAVKEADPQARVSFNPGEAGSLKTFELLDPLCDFWLPYTIHRSYPPQDAAAKRAIFTRKPWMWYTTPCLWDKSPALPSEHLAQIRSVPAQPGQCVGTAFFAFNYPFRDSWDTAYEHIADAAVTVLPSRLGPVSTRPWEAIREGIQHANLAMMVRERTGAASFDDLPEGEPKRLVESGTVEQLLDWLEQNPQRK